MEHSPKSSSYVYRCTASHHKTLEVLGKVKNFMRLSIEELKGYCGLVRHDNSSQSASEAAEALAFRFGWSTEARSADIATAWKLLLADIEPEEETTEVEVVKCEPKDIGKSESKEETKDKQNEEVNVEGKSTKEKGSAEQVLCSSTVPVILKPNSWDKKVLICEVDDPDFSIQGDSGAVGRITVDAVSMSVDVKGRHYRGTIRPGPTIMLLNLAPPVGIGSQTTGPAYKETARVEVVTNEYCNLVFERDLLGSMMGRLEGDSSIRDDESEDFMNTSTKGNKKNGGGGVSGKKRKSSGGDDDDDSEEDMGGDSMRASQSSKVPKISTITHRKRLGGSKKTTKKKANKAKK
jgi:hypothetical protein